MFDECRRNQPDKCFSAPSPIPTGRISLARFRFRSTRSAWMSPSILWPTVVDVSSRLHRVNHRRVTCHPVESAPLTPLAAATWQHRWDASQAWTPPPFDVDRPVESDVARSDVDRMISDRLDTRIPGLPFDLNEPAEEEPRDFFFQKFTDVTTSFFLSRRSVCWTSVRVNQFWNDYRFSLSSVAHS